MLCLTRFGAHRAPCAPTWLRHGESVAMTAFISKLSDAETEAAETQTWIEFAVRCGYLTPEVGKELDQVYNEILSTLVGMINHADSWTLPSARR